MFDHIGIVVSDLGTSKDLYSIILEPLGIELMEDNSDDDGGGWLVYGPGGDAPFFVIAGEKPSFWSENNAFSLSPIHCAFAASSKEAVDTFHKLGIKSGAQDNGSPGDRGRGYYAAYLIDPDGNNIEAGYRMEQA